MGIEPRYTETDGVTVCEDCGVVAAIREAHTRFHSILSSHAWVLAILKTSHLGPAVHDKYDVAERVSRRQFDNWSADALAEVMEAMGEPGEQAPR
jgi:hypothetical protein